MVDSFDLSGTGFSRLLLLGLPSLGTGRGFKTASLFLIDLFSLFDVVENRWSNPRQSASGEEGILNFIATALGDFAAQAFPFRVHPFPPSIFS